MSIVVLSLQRLLSCASSHFSFFAAHFHSLQSNYSIHNLPRMLQNSLKSQFEAKEQELFEIHLQLNNPSRTLFEEVLRKNNEIIKNCLAKFTDVYARYEEYDAAFQRLEEEVGRLGDTQSNFHFEFRRTHLEAEKRQTQLSNEVSMIRNALKIPGKDAPTEVYLNSDFFKSKASKVHPRARERDMSQSRAKTNYIYPRKSHIKQQQEAASECLQSKSIQTEKEEPLHQSSDVCHAQKKQLPRKETEDVEEEPRHKHAYTTTIQEDTRQQEQPLIYLTKQQFRTKLNQVEVRIEERMREVERSKRECDWNHLNFDDLHRYIQDTTVAHLASKAETSYLESSLQNLKEAWQTEERELYLQLQDKAASSVVKSLTEKVDALALQFEGARQANGKNRINFNRSFNYPSGAPSSRAASRDLTSGEKRESRQLVVREEQEYLKKSNVFSSSLGSLCGKREKQVNIDCLAQMQESMNITEKAWKDRVNEILGEGKPIRRAKMHR